MRRTLNTNQSINELLIEMKRQKQSVFYIVPGNIKIEVRKLKPPKEA